jgi:hypothetical protein
MNEEAVKLLVWALTTAIKDVGFPIFVAVYLLLRVDPAIRALTKTIHDLADVSHVAAQLTRRSSDPRS